MDKFIKTLFYLLLAFPLGMFYFVIIVTGLSLGVSLFIIGGLGIPIFIGLFGFSDLFSNYERSLANNFLDAKIPPLAPIETPRGIWPGFKGYFFDGRTWLRLFYLAAKFPLGVVTFTVEVTFFTTSIFLILTPLFYQQAWYSSTGLSFWHATSLPGALLTTAMGIVLAVLFYYLSKGLAVISAEFARSALVA